MDEKGEKVQLDYEILGNAPEILLEGEAVSQAEIMARHSIGEVPPVTVADLKSDETIAKALSNIEVDDPHFKDLKPITDEDVFEIGSLTIAKAKAEEEVVPDTERKSKLKDFEKKIAKSVDKLINSHGKLSQKAIGAGLTLALTACGISPLTPTNTPEVISTEPVVTQPSTTTEGTQSATPTDTETQPPTDTTTPSETPSPTEAPLPMLSENPTADELFAAKEGQIPEKFNFGGHIWTEGVNDKGEKVWTREDGKITFEWASLYGGGRYNAFMFVTRSPHVEGKRSIEIYSDPRSLVFFIINADASTVDAFVGNTVAGLMRSRAAKAALLQDGSTLRFVFGGMEHWPIVSTPFKPANIYYNGLNSEPLSQKIWGLQEVGGIGPFVEPNGSAVQCGFFLDSNGFASWSEWITENPTYVYALASSYIYQAMNYCTYLDPESSTPGTTLNYPGKLLIPLFGTELVK